MQLYSWFNKNAQYFKDDESIQSHIKPQQVDSIIKKPQVEAKQKQ